MKWIEAKVVVQAEEKALALDVVAEIFISNFNIQGVVIETPEIEPIGEYGENELILPDVSTVSGYFPDNQTLKSNCTILEEKLGNLSQLNGFKTSIGYRKIDETDWAESWKTFFWPTRVGRHFVIKPTWRQFSPQAGDHIIEIDPGMAFGSGTHATTILCLELIEEFVNPDMSVLDIGTGSGILLIGAAKMGAKKLMGIDLDQVAIDVTQKNMIQNRINASNYKLKVGDLVGTVHDRFDLICANILLPAIMKLTPDIPRVLNEDGIYICSGLLKKNENQAIELIEAAGLKPFKLCQKDEWIAIAAK